MNADCHYGDHRWQANGQCDDCDAFNGGLLQWAAIEKALREGRHHGNHYHRTTDAAQRCPHPTHDEGSCADTGGCMVHEASDEFMAALGGPA